MTNAAAHLFFHITLVDHVLLDDVFSELVEANLVGEDVERDGERSAQSPRALVVVQDRVETRPVSIEEVLVANRIVVPVESGSVAEQRVREAGQRPPAGFEAQPADVERDLLVVRSAAPSRSVERRVVLVVAVVVAVDRRATAAAGTVVDVVREAAVSKLRLDRGDLAVAERREIPAVIAVPFASSNTAYFASILQILLSRTLCRTKQLMRL